MKTSLPPGPARPALLQTLAWIRRPGPFLEECARRFGGRFTLRFVGGRAYVILSDPADVQEVFSGDPGLLLSGQANRGFKAFLGAHSLFVLDGEAHRAHRRPLLRPFRGERMRAYGDLIHALTLREMARWPVDRAVGIYEAMQEVTLEVIFGAVFGETEPERVARLRRLLERATGRAGALLAFVPALQRDLGLGSWSPWGRFLALQGELHRTLLETIRRARREAAGREDILARLVAEDAEGTWSDEALRDELITLLGAGHETTTATLAWAVLWLLRTPLALARLRAELDAVCGPGALAPQHLPHLPYLEAVVEETLRLNPPIPIALRWLARDAEVAGLALPAATHLCPCPWLTHRDPALYPEPLRFRPERFLEGRPRAWEYFPFGGGGRLCIGAPFAIYETRLILGTLVSRLDLHPAAPPSLAARRKSIILRPRHGTPVFARPRTPPC